MDRPGDRENGQLTGELFRDRGITRATGATSPLIRSKIDTAIKILAATNTPFTTDNVWALMKGGGYVIDHPNVVGGRMRYWLKKALIRRTGETTTSQRASRHKATLFYYVGSGV